MLAFSGAGAESLYVSSFNSGNIYQITTNGVTSVFASNMNYPYGIAFDSAGNLFVANSALDAGMEGCITKISRAGKPDDFYLELDPKAVAVNSAGDVFEADYHSGIIYEYTPGGVQNIFATGFDAPLSLAFDSAGNLFVGDGYGNGHGRVTKVTPNGTKTLVASGLSFPSVALDSAGNLFVSNQGNGDIYKYTPHGAQSTFATVGSGGNNGMAFDQAGNLFLATAAGPIVKITPDGAQSTFATVPGIPAGLAFGPVFKPSIFSGFHLKFPELPELSPIALIMIGITTALALFVFVLGIILFITYLRKKRGAAGNHEGRHN